MRKVNIATNFPSSTKCPISYFHMNLVFPCQYMFFCFPLFYYKFVLLVKKLLLQRPSIYNTMTRFNVFSQVNIILCYYTRRTQMYALVEKNCFVTKPMKFVVRYFVQIYLNLMTHNLKIRHQIHRYSKLSF